MKKNSSVSPVMLEILVVTLFLALSASVLVQLIAKAHDISRAATTESRALILAEDALERGKADPVGDNTFDPDGVRSYAVEQSGFTVTTTITRTITETGAYYDIHATAFDGAAYSLVLTTSRYVPGTEATP